MLKINNNNQKNTSVQLGWKKEGCQILLENMVNYDTLLWIRINYRETGAGFA